MKIQIKKITGKEDLKSWVSWLNDKRSSIYTNRKFKKHTIKSQRKFIEIKKKSPYSFLYKIIYNNRFVGLIELDQVDLNHMHCDIGFMINPKFEGKGITTHALNLICKIAKKKKFRILYGRCYSKNIGSISYNVMFDRIELGTYLIAAALAGKKITFLNVQPNVIKTEINVKAKKD